MRPARILLAAALLWGTAAGAAENLAPGEVVDRTALRVCADPADLPFSNEAGEGFENEIAALMADHMGLPLTYTWFPRTIGFVRSTLRARLCDLVMGVVSTHELMQNTNPYYRSTYVMAIRAADAERFPDLKSPALHQATIGVVAGTPPGDLLVREGLIGRVRSYHLNHDSRVDSPLEDMMRDLAEGTIDVALGWGPALGYFAKRAPIEIEISRLESPDPRIRLDFRISMGVRWGEPDWKHRINRVIAELKPEMERILHDYGVPLLDEQGRLIAPPGGDDATTADAAPEVPEPDGYRMADYRAPVPATLEGATVLDTAALEQLMRSEAPVLIDVLPKPRKPEGRDPDQPWIEKTRKNIPGSHWLPNTGFGELPKEQAAYLEQSLARLTGGDPAKPLVFYCEPACWQSWNAAKRAMTELGYSNVYWYPAGASGWQEAGQLLIEATPEPMS